MNKSILLKKKEKEFVRKECKLLDMENKFENEMESRLNAQLKNISTTFRKEFDAQRKVLEDELEFLTKENKRLHVLLKDAISTNKITRLKVFIISP